MIDRIIEFSKRFVKINQSHKSEGNVNVIHFHLNSFSFDVSFASELVAD